MYPFQYGYSGYSEYFEFRKALVFYYNCIKYFVDVLFNITCKYSYIFSKYMHTRTSLNAFCHI